MGNTAGGGRLFIHCGMHKTGSTAIQKELARLAGPLEADGLYLPQSYSKNRGAHHGLAYALKGPRVFRMQSEKFGALLAEVEAARPSDMCLSSEDFESYLTRPRALSRILPLAKRAGARPVFVLYLRNQIDYFESLYLQLLRMGYGRTVSDTLEEVCAKGCLTFRKWVFQFDYNAVLDALGTLRGDTVCRNYHALAGGSSVADFLQVLDRPGFAEGARTDLRANEARVERNLRRFAVNHLGETAQPAADALDLRIEGQRPRLSQAARQRIAERFAESNGMAEARMGFALPLDASPLAEETGAPLMDRMFEAPTWAAVEQGASARIEDLVASWYAPLRLRPSAMAAA